MLSLGAGSRAPSTRRIIRGGDVRLLIVHGDATARLDLVRVAAGVGGGDLGVAESGKGMEALEMLLSDGPPAIAIVDWDLPECDGPELCRQVRTYHEAGLPYIILLAKGGHSVAEGLEAGADDCVRTPVAADELRARIGVALRFAALPWARAMSAAPSDADGGDSAVIALAAQRSINGDDLDGDYGPVSGPSIELASVLVAD
jgi:DNA-binding response OmpR family regulator